MSDFIDSLIQSRKNGDYMYHQGRVDERKRIIKELEEMKCEYDCTANEFQRGANAGATFIKNKAIEIIKGKLGVSEDE